MVHHQAQAISTPLRRFMKPRISCTSTAVKLYLYLRNHAQNYI